MKTVGIVIAVVALVAALVVGLRKLDAWLDPDDLGP